MNLKKILAGVAASALAVSAMSVCALASEPVKKPESYEKPPMLIGADTILPDTIYGAGVEVTFNLTVNDVNGGWANGSAGIIVDGEILQDEGATVKFGGKECDAASNRSWFPEGSVVIEEGQKTATVVCKADLTGKSGFNIYIFSGQPTDAADNGFFTLDSVTIKNEAGFEATYADGALTIAGGSAEEPGNEASDSDPLSANLETALYVQDNVTWNLTNSDSVTITAAGDYTYSLTDLDIAPSTLTVLYIKDVAVQNETASTSDIVPVKVTYKSLKINGAEVAIKDGAPDGLNDSGAFDCALYNIWGDSFIDLPEANINSVELTVNIASLTEEAGEVTTEAAPEVTEATEATEAATEAPEATEATEATTEAVASSEAVTDAPEGNTSAGTSDKNNADTGVEGVAIVAALAVLAGGAVVIAKKRK